ncbi:MAG: hypothetical protein MUO53_08355 [Maribacter sp.]|nr:hypothetical protein [Maribacter sp.]
MFSTNPAKYQLVHTSFEGLELMNYSPLIYAYQQKNIAITGKGILNGQGNSFPKFRNILLENLHVKNEGQFGILAKGYTESPIRNITHRNVTIEKVEVPYSLENVFDMHFIDTYINGTLVKDADG